MADGADPRQKLGMFGTSALVVGNMVGSGVYLLPASLATYGAVSLYGWLVTCAGAMCLALVFARLSAARPLDGSPYAYNREALGDFTGFLVAWGYWISSWVSNAALAITFAAYLGEVFPVLRRSPGIQPGVAIAAIWILTWVNWRGVRSAGRMQVVTTVLKLAPLVVIGIAGLLALNPDHFVPVNRSEESFPGALIAVMSLTLFAFIGLESGSVPAGAIHNPKHTIPRATIFGTAFTAVLYIVATVGIFGLVSPETLATSEAPFAVAAGGLWGATGSTIVAAGAAISAFGALNGWTLIAAQIARAPALHGLFPDVFKRENSRGAPVVGLVVSSALATGLVSLNFSEGLVEQFTFFILLSTLTILFPYVMSSMALLILFFRNRTDFGQHGVRGTMALGVVGFIYSLWAIAGAGEEVVYWGFILLLAGVPVFAWMTIRRA
jgi:basic amino acid/polyamine antiporter, APA family